MPASIDLIGKTFTRLTVIGRAPYKNHGVPRWLCRCECGNETSVQTAQLNNGTIRSCGCLMRETTAAMGRASKGQKRPDVIIRNFKHGQAVRGHKTRTYRIWCSLDHRTGYEVKPEVCERWKQSFEAFLEDMGERPKGLTIDRIDNAKGYEPGNCRWATMKVQQNNRTNNRRIDFSGENKTLMQWAEITGIQRETISKRLDKLGWSVERALTTKAVKGRNQYT